MMDFTYKTVARFKLADSDGICSVKQDRETGELICDCEDYMSSEVGLLRASSAGREGAFSRGCRHTEYFKANPFIVLTGIPTYQEACHMAWGKDKDAIEEWVSTHLKVIEI